MLEPDPELAVAYGLFSVRQARAAGYSHAEIKRLVRRGTWIRLERGLLKVAGRAEAAGDTLVRTRLAAGPGAVVGFESAASVLGWDLPRTPDRPRLVVPRIASRTEGYRTALSPEDVRIIGVLVVTSPSRTALDIAATHEMDFAVVALDSGLRTGQITKSGLARYFRASRRSGVLAARGVLSATDPASGSVAESEARLLFAKARLPAPLTQYTIRVAGRFIARVDFAWEHAKLAVEIDGFAYHSASGDFQRDRTRQNAVQLTGWLVLRFTVADLRDRPEYVVAQIADALARRS